MSETHAQTVPYVRETMLPEQEAPITERGVVKWIHENLASSWLNGILTLLSILVIFWTLSHVLPWLTNQVWNARSLTECREVFFAMGDGGDGGACWAVLRERWIQFLYGFYPSDAYWRPNLALVLFFVAVAPVLFAERLPSYMLWFTAVFPFIMPWLIWGGSFWTPILAMAGLVVGYGAYRLGAHLGGAILGSVMAVLIALSWWLFFSPMLNLAVHKTVAESRLETVLEQTRERIKDLPVQIAALEEREAAVEAQIKQEEEIKNPALEELTAVSDAASAAAELAIRAELGVAIDADGKDPIKDTATREAVAAAAKRAGQNAVKASEMDPVRDVFLASVQRLTTLNEQRVELSRQLNLLQNEQPEKRALEISIVKLPEHLQEIDGLEENLPDMEKALPVSVQGYKNVLKLPPGTPQEDAAELSAFLKSEEKLVSLENAVESIYLEVGRVGLKPVNSRDIGGFLLAVIIGLSGIVLSLPLGILLALGRQSDLILIKSVSVGFIEIIRGVPLIVWLLTAQLLLNYFLPPGTNFDLLLRVIIMVTLFSSAYIAEVVRGGLAALPRGQYEAADALGLDYWKAQRLIVMPQALKISIPGIVNTFIGLFKDTVLVTFIGLLDPIGLAGATRASSEWNGIYWELFVFIGLMFFIFCFSMGRYSHFLEVKLQREHR